MESDNPKHMISVSAFVTNEKEEVLLLRTHWRSETWEMPGGNVEEGESLDTAVCREYLEETNIVIRPMNPILTNTSHDHNKNLVHWMQCGRNVMFHMKLGK